MSDKKPRKSRNSESGVVYVRAVPQGDDFGGTIDGLYGWYVGETYDIRSRYKDHWQRVQVILMLPESNGVERVRVEREIIEFLRALGLVVLNRLTAWESAHGVVKTNGR